MPNPPSDVVDEESGNGLGAAALADRDSFGGSDGSDISIPVEFSTRSQKHRSMWAQPEFREKVLAKRRATLEAKGRAPRSTRPPLDEAAQKRSDAMRLLRSDEERWITRRLATGVDQRALRNSDELKRQRQEQRAEVARKRWEGRKLADTKATSGATKRRKSGKRLKTRDAASDDA